MPYYRTAEALPQGSPAKVGVLLVNLGTPDSPSYRDVQRYLREFLSDRRVIDTPRAVWLPLLYGVVLPFRPLRTARNYRKIWMPEGSPLAVYSKRLADKIAASLLAKMGAGVEVELAMTYGNPSIASALARLAAKNVTRLLVLPLYPHYCASTTGSVFDAVTAALNRVRYLPETRFVNDYHDDALYIEALKDSIEAHWAAAGERSHLLFSYHGIPRSYVERGDPYQRQAETTTALTVRALGLAAGDYSHCYQSRFGRVEWLKPYTVDTIEKLAADGVKRLTVVSPAFAVDCLETLEEIAIQYRELFLEKGGEELKLVPALNDSDAHVAALSRIIGSHLGGWVLR
ncbi:MAG TPA: ferrochelatase [Steroidobacteraceae bacterium]|jgi:ferrochelatase